MNHLLTEAGEALYGPRWQSEVARNLGCSVRTVQRWVAGVADVRPGVYMDLWRLAFERAQALDAVADKLKLASDGLVHVGETAATRMARQARRPS